MGIDLPLCLEDVDDLLQDIIAKENLKNSKVTFKSGSKVGEGYLGINSAVEISDPNKTLHLFIKAAPKQLTMRKMAHIRAAYENEFHFYKTIYPSMKIFYRNKTGKSLRLVPKIYAANVEEMKEIIALENLRTRGFSLNGRKNILNKEQVILIMKEYGRFHAISFALKDQQDELFTKLSKNLPQLLYLWLDAMKVIPTIKLQCKLIEKYLGLDEDNVVLEKVKYLSENIDNFFLKIKSFNAEHRVILHGDCNYNNMMFRNNKENNLEVRFLDFQAINLNSPVMDLVYFFYGSASSEENLSQLDFFLNIYHDSLSMTIRELGSDAEKLCPLSVIKDHWKIFSVFGLMIAFMTTSMMVNEAEVLENVSEAMSGNATDSKHKREPMKNEKEFARRIKYLIKHFIDNNLI